MEDSAVCVCVGGGACVYVRTCTQASALLKNLPGILRHGFWFLSDLECWAQEGCGCGYWKQEFWVRAELLWHKWVLREDPELELSARETDRYMRDSFKKNEWKKLEERLCWLEEETCQGKVQVDGVGQCAT